MTLRQSIGTGFGALVAATALAVMRASLQHWLAVHRATELPTLVQAGFDRLGTGLATIGREPDRA